MFCTRCKRKSHYRDNCRAKTFVDGNPIGRGGNKSYKKKYSGRPNRRY